MNLSDGTPVRFITGDDGSVRVDLRGDVPVGRATYSVPFDLYIPYTKVDERTVRAAPSSAQWVDVSASPLAYYAALLNWWDKGETFAITEHDVVCRPDIIEAFDACPEPWCVFPYADICHWSCMEAWANELGCTRFRSELIQEVPEALSSIPPDNWDWHEMCNGVGRNLRAARFTHHWHEPAVEHHHFR